MSAPASSSICTMASSPRTQAYIRGVIPCRQQDSAHVNVAASALGQRFNEAQMLILSPSFFIYLSYFLCARALNIWWNVEKFDFQVNKTTPLSSAINHTEECICDSTCSLGSFIAPRLTVAVPLSVCSDPESTCNFHFGKKSVLHLQSFPGGSLHCG